MRQWWAVLVDVVLVVVFAAIGRASHDEGLAPVAVATVAWPFLVGALVGWMLLVVVIAKRSWWVEGIVVWVCTLVLGMMMRVISGGGAQTSFVLVAGLFLALFLLGWRAIAALVLRRGHAPDSGLPQPAPQAGSTGSTTTPGGTRPE